MKQISGGKTHAHEERDKTSDFFKKMDHLLKEYFAN